MEKLRLGVVGLGEGRSIISAALGSSLWELVRICDLNERLCKDRAAEFSFSRWTTRMEELLGDSSIDVIGLYTPDSLHAKHIAQCLSAGKHVICTKPLIDNLADAPALLDAAKRSGRQVFVGQSCRFFGSMMRQRADFEAGRHGNLFSVEAHYHADNRWFLERDWARSGGLRWLFGGLSHPVDLVRWYLPEITEVMGYGLLTENGRRLGLKHPDAMHFVMATDDGRIARVSGCFSSPTVPAPRDSHITCVLRGLNGVSQADYGELRYTTHFTGQGPQHHSLEDQAPYYFRFEGRTHHAGEYQNYIEHFARCLKTGQTPKPDLEEGIGTVAVLAAMERAMQTRQPVKTAEMLAEHGVGRLNH